MNEEKNNNILIIIIVLLIGVVGCLGYLYVNKDSTKCAVEEKNKTKTETKEKEIPNDNTPSDNKDYSIKYDIPSDEKECYENVKKYLDRTIEVLNQSSTNGLLAHRLFEEKDAVLTIDEKLYMIYYYLTDYFHMPTTSKEYILRVYGEKILSSDTEGQELSGDIIRGMYYLIFGEKINSLKNLKGCPNYYYDNKNDVVYRELNCGGTGYRKTSYKNIAYSNKDDEYYVYQKVLFTGDGIYYDVEGKNSVDYIDGASIDEYFYKYQDKIKTLKYTFKIIVPGVYQFVKVEEI